MSESVGEGVSEGGKEGGCEGREEDKKEKRRITILWQHTNTSTSKSWSYQSIENLAPT